MKTDALVSIVLPTHNGSRHIEESIRSCQSQTYKNWELVVVDDACSDSTPDIVNRYASSDSRIHCVRHDENRKLPAALNTGFARARGAYLTWTSDDNYYRPTALKTMVAFLKKAPQVHMVYSDFTIVNENGDFVKRESVRPPEQLLKGNCVGPSFLFRREVLEVTGPYAEELLLAEDYDYWLRVSTRFNMIPLHQDLYCYRVHQKSLTAHGLDRRHRVTEKALARNLPLMRWVSPSEKSDAYTVLARIALSQRDGWATMKYLTRALLYSPPFLARYGLRVLRRRYEIHVKPLALF